MVKTCVIVNCRTGYKKRQHKVSYIPEKFPVFCFPLKNQELNKKWITFVNRKDWTPTQYGGICSKHFEERFLKVGKRTTLRWNLEPVPSIYSHRELTLLTSDLTRYVCQSFAMLELYDNTIRKTEPHERDTAENELKFNDLPVM